MSVLNPIPDEPPNPDCAHCNGQGVPQSRLHAIIAEEWSNAACDYCWKEEETDI